MSIKKNINLSKFLKDGTNSVEVNSPSSRNSVFAEAFLSSNIIGTTTEKSKIATIKQYNKIYSDIEWDQAMEIKEDKTIGMFNVNGKLTKIWKITNPRCQNDSVTKAMIFIHGLRNSHWNAITFARQMLKNGYVIYAYDQRESGENINNGKISFGQNEADDLNNIYKKITAHKNNPYLKELIIYGQSNGAGTTLSFGEKYQSSIDDAKNNNDINTTFMIESGFVSGRDAIDGLIGGMDHANTLLSWMITPQIKEGMNQLMGITENFNYANHINEIKQKLYIAHGDMDKIISVEQGQKLYEARADKEKTFYHEWIGLGHIGISLARESQDEMFFEAISFLENKIIL